MCGECFENVLRTHKCFNVIIDVIIYQTIGNAVVTHLIRVIPTLFKRCLETYFRLRFRL